MNNPFHNWVPTRSRESRNCYLYFAKTIELNKVTGLQTPLIQFVLFFSLTAKTEGRETISTLACKVSGKKVTLKEQKVRPTYLASNLNLSHAG